MKHLLYLVMLMPLVVNAQVTAKSNSIDTVRGIQWAKGLSWKEIQKKARKEKKYIFVDCYATWCGPCKRMEKEVFTDKKVGDFFNQHFISVRLQMDKTKNDNAEQRNWYTTAETINKQQGVPAYPTFLFFSPTSEVVYRALGYMPSYLLLHNAEMAIKPGMQLPYRAYYAMLVKYQQGKKEYATMAALADTAKLLRQDDIATAISKEYREYLMGRNKSEWFSPSNIHFMASFVHGSQDTFFTVFYKDGALVDSVSGQKGLSRFVVDKIVQSKDIDSVTKPIRGARSSKYQPTSEPEPDWKVLQDRVAAKYNDSVAERNVLYSRIVWYEDHHEWTSASRYFALFVTKYPPYYLDGNLGVFINMTCYDAIFKRSVVKEEIDAACRYLDLYMRLESSKGGAPAAVRDTYANLLYKAGRKEEAIEQEKEALKKDNAKDMQETLTRMKQGRPTWPHYISNNFFDNGIID